MSALPELAELVYQSFERCHDLEIAFAKVCVSDDDRAAIEADANFQARVRLVQFEMQEHLFAKLRNLMESDNESIAYQATMRLGEMLYAKRFKGDASQDTKPLDLPTVIMMKGASDD
jgi:hypothetical protein